MADDHRFPHTRVPHFLCREKYPNLTPSIACTYLAARRFAYVRSRANERFSRTWASMTTIGAVFGQSRDTVKRNLHWLERHGLLYRKPRGFNKSWEITF